MDNTSVTTSFTNEITNLVDSYSGLMSYHELIGLLEILKQDLYYELREVANE